MAKNKYYSFDIETHDPHLIKKGLSYQWGEGEILCFAVYDVQKDKNTGYWWNKKSAEVIKSLLLGAGNVMINANPKYDIMWLCYALDMKVRDIKAAIIDVQMTECLINPFADYDLDALAQRYLKQPKGKIKLENLCAKHKLRGDFRQHLKALLDLGYKDELMEYVLSDSSQPYHIHKKQMEKLVCPIETFDIYQKINIISAQMQQDGIRIDKKKWDENRLIVDKEFELLKKRFEKKYGDFNINSPAQVGKFLTDNGFDTQFKITVRGLIPKGDQKFSMQRDGFTDKQRRFAAERLFNITTAFQHKKGKLYIEVPAAQVSAYEDAINKLGYATFSSPLTGKDHLEHSEVECVRDFKTYKQVSEIRKKFFGDEFEKYMTRHITGEWRIHATFQPVGARTTARFSCTKPNLQNIPARVILYEGTKKEINVSEMAREVFIPEKGCKLVKLDYSGQELRMAAHFAIGDDGEYIRALYRKNPKLDEHQLVVDNAPDLTAKHEPDIARKLAKNIRFGVSYGATYKRIAQMNGWSYDEAKTLVDIIDVASPWASLTRQQLVNDLKRGKIQGIVTILGRRIPLIDINRAYAHYNYLIQGSCADQMKRAMILVYDYLTKNNLHEDIKMILTVHDELVLSVKTADATKKKLLPFSTMMEKAVESPVPFIVEPEIGNNWNAVKPFVDKLSDAEEDFE